MKSVLQFPSTSSSSSPSSPASAARRRCFSYHRAHSSSAACQTRKALLRRIQKQEIRRLQSMLPRLQTKRQQRFDELLVLEETVRYIDQLHATLLARVQAGNFSEEALLALQQADPTYLDRIRNIHAMRFQPGSLRSAVGAPATVAITAPSAAGSTSSQRNHPAKKLK